MFNLLKIWRDLDAPEAIHKLEINNHHPDLWHNFSFYLPWLSNIFLHYFDFAALNLQLFA
jgi:hypothetical protein